LLGAVASRVGWGEPTFPCALQTQSPQIHLFARRMQETSASQHKLLRCASQPNSDNFGIDSATHADGASLVVVNVPERYPSRAPPNVIRYFNRGYGRIARRYRDISDSLDDNLVARRACGEFHQFQGLCCCRCDSARCSSGASGTSPSAICAELRQADPQRRTAA
jgi:hypothetical protein